VNLPIFPFVRDTQKIDIWPVEPINDQVRGIMHPQYPEIAVENRAAAMRKILQEARSGANFDEAP